MKKKPIPNFPILKIVRSSVRLFTIAEENELGITIVTLYCGNFSTRREDGNNRRWGKGDDDEKKDTEAEGKVAF